MSTTTIRIDEDLKARVAAVAERAGKTPHSFILDAIAQATEEAERNDEFHRIADERWARYLETGETVPWKEARAYLQARASGKKPTRPRARRTSR
jgi:predicted transcriptional regulator